MTGWCESCWAIAQEGWCSKHGETKPIAEVNKVELNPLPDLEKQFLNEQMNTLTLGEGIFFLYGDRYLRRIVVALDKPLAEIKIRKNGLNITPLAKGEILGMNPDSLYDANSQRLDRLSTVSKSFARQELESAKNSIISFSAGKDSVVLAHLLEEFKLKKVFIDTGIEFPETYSFIKTLKGKGWDIDCAKAESSFLALCSQKGYPSRKNRWCCKTQKFGPFEKYIKETFGDEEVCVFSATRRWESMYRMDEPFKRQHRHIHNQYSVNIMLDWTAMDVWNYTWRNELPVNAIYNCYDRGGCWACPFGLTKRIFMMKYAHPKFYDFLEKVGATSGSFGVSFQKCTEGKSMNHIVFLDTRVGNATAGLLQNMCDSLEIHDGGKVICVPSNMPKAKLQSLVRKARARIVSMTV